MIDDSGKLDQEKGANYQVKKEGAETAAHCFESSLAREVDLRRRSKLITAAQCGGQRHFLFFSV